MIVIVGNRGMLGTDVEAYCVENKLSYIGFDYPEIDITNLESLRTKLTSEVKSIINCAAYTAVDKAEEDAINAMNVNAIGIKNIAIVAEEIGAEVIQISTDYVFDGFDKEYYDEMDTPNPISVYGKSKYLGEQYLQQFSSKYYILRTSWLFGHAGNNFIKTMINLSDLEELNVVNDQFGAPTSTKDLVRVIFDVINSGKYGVYHATSEGRTTWYEFAKFIFDYKGLDVNLKPCTTDKFPTAATRPANSELKSLMLQCSGFDLMPEWKDAVRKYLEEEM